MTVRGCDWTIGLYAITSFVIGVLVTTLANTKGNDPLNSAVEPKTAIIGSRPIPDHHPAAAILSDALDTHDVGSQSSSTVGGVNTGLAKLETLGWFDESDSLWNYRKKHAIAQLPLRDAFPRVAERRLLNGNVGANNALFQFNFRPIMECPEKVLLNHGLEGKFLCGGHRLAQKEKCVIYSIGSRGDYSFEEDMHAINPNCEIHTFDPGGYDASSPSFINFNRVALGSEDQVGRNHSGGGRYATFTSLMKELGHTSIDVLKIDCDGCEYKIYEQLKGVPFDQLLIEIHRFPEGVGSRSNIPVYMQMMNTFFDYGLVPVAREANLAFDRNGEVWAAEFVFIRLKRGIFGLDFLPIHEAYQNWRTHEASVKWNKK